jgi:uncharacterized membrane protein YqgA involved in biofilm formation
LFPGTGTLVNATTVLVGASLGVLAGHRLPARTRDVVTDALGLVTLLIAASTAVAVHDPALLEAVGSSAPVLIVLGSLVLGGVIGSLVGIEDALERFAGWLRAALLRGGGDRRDRERFVEGFVSSSVLFCVGPLTVLGSLSDGLGRGADQLYLKSALDGFASIAFAAALVWGVALAAGSVLVIQGGLSLAAGLFENVLADGSEPLAALVSAGGVLIIGISLKLLGVKDVRVGNFLPALVLAPCLVGLVSLFR